MKPRIGVIIHRPLRQQLFDPADWDRLCTLGDVVATDRNEPISPAEAVEILRCAEIAVGSWWSPGPTAAIFAAAPALRLWEHVAGSPKHLFAEDWGERQLTIASCKGAIAECVAELVVGELIVGLRRVAENAAANRTGLAERPTNLRVLAGSRVGIIGASEVGKLVMSRLRPFGCAVDLYDPFVSARQATEWGVTLVSDLVVLCGRCQAVTLHTPLLPATRGLLQAQHFRAMADDAVFINTARGECLDETALIAELTRGRLRAYLDVSAPEPAAIDSPLRRLPNVSYTSHIAGPATFNMGRRAVDDIEAFLRGDAPQCVVTRDMLGRIA